MENSKIESVRRAEILTVAEFDPRLRTYSLAIVSIILVISIVGILLLPLWLIFGKKYIHRYYDSLECVLTTRALHYKKGIWFQTERSIPLDKIQDLTFHEGPFLRYFGLSTLKIETAGQSAQGNSDMSLTGIVDARNFREKVNTQRDEITDIKQGLSGTPEKPEQVSLNEAGPLLQEISETLKRIEKKIKS